MKTITAITSILTASVVIMTGMSCSKSEYRENHDLTNHIFHATFETSQVETKTYIDSNHKLLWTADDRLSIFEGDTYNQQYKYSGQTGKKDADFERVSSGTHSGNTISTNYAVYPYSETTEINDSEQLTIVLPSVQTYAPGSFGLGANTMVAVTKDKNDTALGFKNLCGYLVLKLYGQGSVKSITLTANNGEKISGTATVTAGYNQNPSVTMLQTAEDYIMLDCGSGVALGSNSSSATEFWFCLPPVTFSKGFSIMVKSNDGGFMEKSVSASRTIKRNTFYSMTALEAEFEIPEPEAVDLGLSVKWASFNVGATAPEEYGSYFAWGETVGDPYVTGKTSGYTKSFNWSTYTYCKGSDTTMTKYCDNNSYGYNGFIDYKTVLELSDDAARANWGGKWRMPTRAEFDELSNNCTWTWTTQNGVNGYKVVSKKSGYEGRFIFLPAAGYRNNTILTTTGSLGHYWSSSLTTHDPYDAWSLYFFSNLHGADNDTRYYGYSVRPVCPFQATGISLSKQSVEITVGETETLTATVQYENGATGSTATWSSNNTGVATVDQNGKVTAVNAGTATITVRTNDGGYTAACTVTVQGSSTGNYENGYEYVDLGLSVKWATCNVGATSPEGYGSYFAWGETVGDPYVTGKTSGYTKSFNWSTYKYCKGDYNTITKYCNNSNYGYNGFTDNKTTLELSDDAARANWGGKWRMPTRAEFDELSDNCTWTWATQNGVNGYKVVSKKSGYEGRFIFLPAAGDRGSTNLYDTGSDGIYLSSSLNASLPYHACSLGFYSGGHSTSSSNRCSGFSVRPVCPFQATGISLSKQSVEITVGGTETLTATVQYENGATGSTATWSSNNTGVVTVDQNGKVTAVKEGTATITVKTSDGGYTATCAVTVKGASSGYENGYEYVDLGLSVKWATCNIGATSPEGYGSYFAWGETVGDPYVTGKTSGYTKSFNWSTYKYCKGDYNTMTKYCNNSNYGYNGFTDGKTTLELSDDAARANWGGRWRMPTHDEFTELSNSSNCTWTWTTQNGVNGYKVVSKKSGYEGRFIFLPAAGYRDLTSLYHTGGYGYYWSSSLDTALPDYAWVLSFYSGGHYTSNNYRCRGFSVRPVCQ